MAVSKRLRYEILRRDNHTCRYCGAAAPDVTLTVDHVVPVALGGSDEASNLVASCADCNSGKSSTNPDDSLVEDVEQDALRWSKAMQRAADAQREVAYQREVLTDDLGEWWLDVWCHPEDDPRVLEGTWHYVKDPDTEYSWAVERNQRRWLFHDEGEAHDFALELRQETAPPLAHDWRASARSWFDAGIQQRDYVPLMESVRDDRKYVDWDAKWKYFAGCVWNVIRERQRIAAAMLAADEGT